MGLKVIARSLGLILPLLSFHALAAGGNIARGPAPQPDSDRHRAFLYNGDWRAARPSVLVFIDPYCPYCLKDLPRLDAIRDYNVFVFWAPILGPRSVSAVDGIFRCDGVASPELLDRIGRRQPPQCDGEFDRELRRRNDLMVTAYDINAVPAYYLQGRRVSRGFLEQPRRSARGNVGP